MAKISKTAFIESFTHLQATTFIIKTFNTPKTIVAIAGYFTIFQARLEKATMPEAKKKGKGSSFNTNQFRYTTKESPNQQNKNSEEKPTNKPHATADNAPIIIELFNVRR